MYLHAGIEVNDNSVFVEMPSTIVHNHQQLQHQTNSNNVSPSSAAGLTSTTTSTPETITVTVTQSSCSVITILTTSSSNPILSQQDTKATYTCQGELSAIVVLFIRILLGELNFCGFNF